jgi:hypothetical protein
MYHATNTKESDTRDNFIDATHACEILNKRVNFDDFTNVSEFRIGKDNTFIYVRGPSHYQRRGVIIERMSEEEFAKRLAPYVDDTHITYEGHKSGTYFVLEQSAVQQVLDIGRARQILHAEHVLHLMSSSSSTTPLSSFFKHELFDANLINEINMFLP